mgnify:CR=1 FL=1
MKHRRVVFLDIDGVLNDVHFIDAALAEAERTGEQPPDPVAALAALIDARRVGYLNQIVEESGAEVVAATSWREILSVDELDDALRRNGFCTRLSGATPQEPARRGEQIAQWLAENEGVEAFVVLDDHHDTSPVEAATLRTDNTVGLTDAHVREAIRRLA